MSLTLRVQCRLLTCVFVTVPTEICLMYIMDCVCMCVTVAVLPVTLL